MAFPTVQTPATEYSWPEQGQWTYSDWLRLPNDGFHYEVIDGELFVSPSPSSMHQMSIANLLTAMNHFARANSLGIAMTAPLSVRLTDDEIVVQPDLFFISRERLDIIYDEGVRGVPDLVVEVLSPSNWVYDRGRKQKTYEKAGVREYWIVDYRARTVDVLVLEGSEYVQRGQYHEGDLAPSEALPGFTIPVADIFAR